MKRIVRILLLLFVAASATYLVVNEYVLSHQDAGVKENERAEVIVYYFHGERRCVTCRTIEAYIAESLKTYFPDDLAAGKLSWEPINIDEPWNDHFVEEYAITTSTAVLVDMRGKEAKKSKKLDRVWKLVRDKEAFFEYIHREVAGFLLRGNEDE